MKNRIKITNSRRGPGPATIDIEGMIGVPEEWQFDEPAARVSTYNKFQKAVSQIAKIRNAEVIVNIRSTGGDVNDALLIYDALESLDAHITTRCWGYVASSATIIAQAASPGGRQISANALYLIHNSTANCEGTTDELRQGSELLEKTDRRIAAIYAEKSGRPLEGFKELMGENGGFGKWLSAAEALEAGLADCIYEFTAVPQNVVVTSDPMSWEQSREIEKLNHKISVLESENAQLRARPTEVKIDEDPSPNAESRRSTNQQAYDADVAGFIR